MPKNTERLKTMLPKKRRLKRELIKKILKKGKIFNSRDISLKTLFVPGQLSSFAVIVSRKTEKKAVDRNKIKRREKGVILKILPKVKEGFLTIIFLKKGSAGLKSGALKEETEKLLISAKIVNKI